jgi:hypothetical protein
MHDSLTLERLAKAYHEQLQREAAIEHAIEAAFATDGRRRARRRPWTMPRLITSPTRGADA